MLLLLLCFLWAIQAGIKQDLYYACLINYYVRAQWDKENVVNIYKISVGMPCLPLNINLSLKTWDTGGVSWHYILLYIIKFKCLMYFVNLRHNFHWEDIHSTVKFCTATISIQQIFSVSYVYKRNWWQRFCKTVIPIGYLISLQKQESLAIIYRQKTKETQDYTGIHLFISSWEK